MIPRRTAGECVLPDGLKVWICTLNSAQRLEAEKRARRYAAGECRSLLKGGRDYASVLAEAKSLTPAEQAAYLASQETWQIRREVTAAFPLPSEPEQCKGNPAPYSQAVAKWEKETARVEKQRKAEEASRLEAAKAGYLALEAMRRMEACCTAFYNAEFGEAYFRRLNMETLLRAVRDPEDHLQRRFGSPEEVEDLDDAVRQALLDKYKELDALTPAEVPTSPLA
ncbi:MAG TPA: hypothetical protein VKT32_10665 [Chthonomonadaceae bacterium]|nr:hypothetical protein [Chthonomonadaceae bacterium]